MTDFRQNNKGEYDAPEHFKAILRDGEYIEWVGAPDRATYMRQGYVFLAFGLVWGFLDLGFITMSMGGGAPGGMGFFLVPFFLLHLFPFWGSILNMIRLSRNASKVRYAYTSERILMSDGLWGTNVKSIYYDSIKNLSLSAVSNNKGTIEIDTGSTGRRGRSVKDKLVGIENPSEVYRAIDRYRQGNRQPMAPPIDTRREEIRFDERRYEEEPRNEYRAPNAAPNAMFKLPNREEETPEEEDRNDENNNDWMKF